MLASGRLRTMLAVVTITLWGLPLQAQSTAAAPDPGMTVAQMGSPMMKLWLTKAGELMADADFAYRPTADTRTFGQLLGHVGDVNYQFCSAALGEQPPVRGIEKGTTQRTEIIAAMAASFAYCDAALAAMTPESSRRMVPFMGGSMPALSVLLFRTHHLSLHYGNAVTYMRLRGKVPPSTAGMP